MKRLLSLFLCILMLSTCVISYNAYYNPNDTIYERVLSNTDGNIKLIYNRETKVAKLEGTGVLPAGMDLSDWDTWDYYETDISKYGHNPYLTTHPTDDISDEDYEKLNFYEITENGTTLIIGEGITELEPFSCMFLGSISSVVLPDSLKKIGRFAFLECDNLTTIYGKNVEKIDGGAFYNCPKLKSVSFPNAVDLSDNICHPYLNIDEHDDWPRNFPDTFNVGAFNYCNELTTVNIPKAEKIGARTFYGCLNLKTINSNNTLSDVTEIGASAFYNCQSLKKISLPKVQSLYSSKTMLKTAAYEGTFYNCESLESINIPKVTKIGANTFFNCKKLKKINSSNNLSKVTELGSGAFAKCSSLEKISLPKVEKLLMAKWTEDNVREGNSAPDISEYYDDDDYYVVYYGDKYYGTFQGCSSLKSISIPQVKVVGARAFYGCSSLKSISIPNATSIGSSAFYNCKNLTSAYLPNVKSLDSVRWTSFKKKNKYFKGNFENCKKLSNLTTGTLNSVGTYAFKNCSSLTKVKLGGKLKSIGTSAFNNCSSLKSITITKNVEKIGKSAFYKDKNLTKIKVNSTKINSVGKNAFGKINPNAKFTAPKKQIKKYKKLFNTKSIFAV
ncbi:MAG: leucine-rich repeat domain-containing protein [Ruminococcus sp.]